MLAFEEFYKICEYSNWTDFVRFLMRHLLPGKTLWRGQADANWSVVPSYLREIEEKIKEEPQNEFKLRESIKYQINQDYKDLIAAAPLKKNEYTVDPVELLLPQDGGICFSDYVKKFNSLNKSRTFLQMGSKYDITFGIEMDLTQWVWGQHYGVSTPLVDWTRSALHALFFACSTYYEIDDNVTAIAIYELDVQNLATVNEDNRIPGNRLKDRIFSKEECYQKKYGYFDTILKNLAIPINIKSYLGSDSYNEKLPVLLDMKKMKLVSGFQESSLNKRLISQSGFFTFTPGGISVEEWCRRYYEATKGDIYQLVLGMPLLTKHIIQTSKIERAKCIHFLDSSNINFKTVYPDFQGVSAYIKDKNRRLEMLGMSARKAMQSI